MESDRDTAVHGRLLRVDRLRLSWRTDAVPLADDQLELRHHGYLRLPQGGLLHSPGAMGARPPSAVAHPALELAGQRRPADQSDGDVQRRDDRAAAERAFAGPAACRSF